MTDDQKCALHYLYDRAYTGQTASVFVGAEKHAEQYSNEELMEIIRYACTYYLRWDLEYASEHLTERIAKKMKLQTVIRRYQVPKEISEYERVAFVRSQIPMDNRKYVKFTCVAKAYISALEKEQVKAFPRCLLAGDPAAAKMNSEICLATALFRYTDVASWEECRELMCGKQSKANAYLRKWKLYNIMLKRFGSPKQFFEETEQLIRNNK